MKFVQKAQIRYETMCLIIVWLFYFVICLPLLVKSYLYLVSCFENQASKKHVKEMAYILYKSRVLFTILRKLRYRLERTIEYTVKGIEEKWHKTWLNWADIPLNDTVQDTQQLGKGLPISISIINTILHK